jgi:hypothetical protein
MCVSLSASWAHWALRNKLLLIRKIMRHPTKTRHVAEASYSMISLLNGVDHSCIFCGYNCLLGSSSSGYALKPPLAAVLHA